MVRQLLAAYSANHPLGPQSASIVAFAMGAEDRRDDEFGFAAESPQAPPVQAS
jgi:hypothetical protein